MAIDAKSSCEIWVGGSLLLKLHFFLYGKKSFLQEHRNILCFLREHKTQSTELSQSWGIGLYAGTIVNERMKLKVSWCLDLYKDL